MSKANERQEGGNHYKKGGEEHWDRMVRILGLDQARGYFIASSTKYIERYQWKNGIEDLKKARHFIDKLIELEEAELQRIRDDKFIDPMLYPLYNLSVSFDSYGCQRVYDPYFDRDADGNRLATEPLPRHPSHIWTDDDYSECTRCGSHYLWLSAFAECSGHNDFNTAPKSATVKHHKAVVNYSSFGSMVQSACGVVTNVSELTEIPGEVTCPICLGRYDNKQSGKVDNSSPDYKDGIKATSSPEDTTKSTTHIFLSGELNKIDSSRNKLKVNLPGDNDLVQNGHGWAEPPDPI